MPDPERDLEIPPFPIEELLTSQDREDIKSSAEDLVASSGEEPVYLTKPQMDERLETLRGFKGSFLDTEDPLVTENPLAGSKPLATPPAGEGKSIFEEAGVDLKGEAEAVAKAAEGLFEVTPEAGEEKGKKPETEEKEEEVAAEVEGAGTESLVEASEPEKKEEAGIESKAPAAPEPERDPEPEREPEGAAGDERAAGSNVPVPLPMPAIPDLPETAAAKVEDRPDRRVSLVFFGAGLIGMAILWALIGGLFFVADSRGDGAFEIGLAPVLWCGAWAVSYLVIGFGSICFRRWARSLAVVAGWVWMAIGVVLVVGLGILFNELTAFLEADGVVAAAFEQEAENFMVLLLGAVTVVSIFVPGLMILYGSAPSVKSTCERWHQGGSWTDRRATGMLVFGGLLACLAFWFGAAAARETWFLWYGAEVEGLPAQQIYAGACGAALVLAVLTLDLRRGIWWVLLLGVLAGTAVMAGPWLVLLGDLGAGAPVGEGEFGIVKTAGLVAGVWAAMLLFVLFLRKCLAPKDGSSAGSAGGGGGEDPGSPLLKGA